MEVRRVRPSRPRTTVRDHRPQTAGGPGAGGRGAIRPRAPQSVENPLPVGGKDLCAGFVVEKRQEGVAPSGGDPGRFVEQGAGEHHRPGGRGPVGLQSEFREAQIAACEAIVQVDRAGELAVRGAEGRGVTVGVEDRLVGGVVAADDVALDVGHGEAKAALDQREKAPLEAIAQDRLQRRHPLPGGRGAS